MMRRDELGQLELDEADLEGVEEEQDTEQRPLEGAELV